MDSDLANEDTISYVLFCHQTLSKQWTKLFAAIAVALSC